MLLKIRFILLLGFNLEVGVYKNLHRISQDGDLSDGLGGRRPAEPYKNDFLYLKTVILWTIAASLAGVVFVYPFR